ncbi:MAG: Gfo/Idh/MocA family oxidoreductase [Lachnospiraceae bacterium]|nr:Gfo/Idh/MocA family oxidoreductase [Lachnospiraceae bacterium]
MNMAILGAGGIAHTMAGTIIHMKGEVNAYAIASRDAAKAEKFQQQYGFEKAYGSYEEMIEDNKVDLVYIATPHSQHYQWTMRALEAGKNVLCEKAFAANEQQAKEMIDFAEKKHLLLTEAIWTRYMPSRQLIREAIDSGIIGKVHTITANLGYDIDNVPRMILPELAGGALLDLSVYPINFVSMVMGDDIRRLTATCVKTETGVDGQDNFCIEYADGSMASLFTSMYCQTNRMGVISGEDGFIEVENINNPKKITAFRHGGKCDKTEIRTWGVPEQISGYEYEVRSTIKAIEERRIECPEMPHSETLEIMRQMDCARKQFGIVFPFEK